MVYDINKSDMKVFSDFRYVVHQNYRTHLDGRNQVNQSWQIHWTSLMELLGQRYNLPTGVMGIRFLGGLTMIMTSIVYQQWNLEWLVFYPIVIPQ